MSDFRAGLEDGLQKKRQAEAAELTARQEQVASQLETAENHELKVRRLRAAQTSLAGIIAGYLKQAGQFLAENDARPVLTVVTREVVSKTVSAAGLRKLLSTKSQAVDEVVETPLANVWPLTAKSRQQVREGKRLPFGVSEFEAVRHTTGLAIAADDSIYVYHLEDVIDRDVHEWNRLESRYQSTHLVPATIPRVRRNATGTLADTDDLVPLGLVSNGQAEARDMYLEAIREEIKTNTLHQL